ncbi:MAG: Spy/CpxP family protein refolding chaperone [Endomicrobiales bacterium]
MRKSVVTVLAGLFAVLASNPLYAGNGKAQCTPGDKACKVQPAGTGQERKLETMSQALDLTPEQKEKVAAIMKESGEKAREEMKKSRESVKAIRTDSEQKIREVLTPEQAQKYGQLKAERTAKREKKKHRGAEKK